MNANAQLTSFLESSFSQPIYKASQQEHKLRFHLIKQVRGR